MKRRRLEDELDRDIQEHIDLETQENIARGMTPEEAHHAALRKFGNIARVKEDTRRVWGWIWLDQFSLDCRYGLRALRKNPGFTVMAVLSLSLGIGTNTAIFSIFDGLFLSSLAFPDSDRLVYLTESVPSRNLNDVRIAPYDYVAWRAGNQTCENMALFQENGGSLSGMGETIRINGASVTHEMATTLGIRPILGRDLRPGEDRPGRGDVMLLGYTLWQSKFGGTHDVLGRLLQIDDAPFTVVGILPPTALFPAGGDYWIPAPIDPNNQRGRGLVGVARLKRGVTLEQARADLMRIHKSLASTSPANKITQPALMSLRDRYLGDYRSVLQALMCAVGFVLLIACANVAGLVTARSSGRARELAVRAALGAGRPRLAQQLLVESLLMAVIGGGVGVSLGWLGLHAILTSKPDLLPSWVAFHLNVRIILFAVAITGVAAVVSSLSPAFEFSQVNVRGFLAEAALKSSLSRGRRRGMDAMVIAEIAVALLLLVCGGLVVRAFQRVLSTHPGFVAQNVLTFAINPAYNRNDQLIRFYEGVLSGLRSAPGVGSAGAVTWLPFDDPFPGGTRYRAEGVPERPPDEEPVVTMRNVSPGYFQAMGIALRAGREFDDHDGASGGLPAVIVNEAFARHFWPNEGAPLSRRVTPSVGNPKWFTVVGVARDVRNDGLDRDARPWIYSPYRQSERVPVQMFFVVRGAFDPKALIATAREIVRRADPGLAIYDVYTLQERLDRSLWGRRAYSWLFGVFAATALAMAVGGIYGVVSYTVAQRTREIGIRMALGAKPINVVTQVLREGLVLVLVGMSIGLIGAWSATSLMQTLLAGVSPHDPLAYIAVTILLSIAALMANLIPAIRAAAIDPVHALRFE